MTTEQSPSTKEVISGAIAEYSCIGAILGTVGSLFSASFIAPTALFGVVGVVSYKAWVKELHPRQDANRASEEWSRKNRNKSRHTTGYNDETGADNNHMYGDY